MPLRFLRFHFVRPKVRVSHAIDYHEVDKLNIKLFGSKHIFKWFLFPMMIKWQEYLSICWICILTANIHILCLYVQKPQLCLFMKYLLFFSNFLLIACDSVILDSLKHVFYIVLHMNLTLSLYLTHSFFRFSLFLFLSVLNPPRSSPYLPFWKITTWPSSWDWEILLK